MRQSTGPPRREDRARSPTALPIRPRHALPRGRPRSPVAIVPAFPETSRANRRARALKPCTRLSATSCFHRWSVQPCSLGGPAWPQHTRTVVRSRMYANVPSSPNVPHGRQLKFRIRRRVKGQRHQADDRIRPGNVALHRPAVRVVSHLFVRLAFGKRNALGAKPSGPLGRRGAGGRERSRHRMPFGATTWKIREMCAPASTGFRHKNGEIVLHGPAPFTEHRTLHRHPIWGAQSAVSIKRSVRICTFVAVTWRIVRPPRLVPLHY